MVIDDSSSRALSRPAQFGTVVVKASDFSFPKCTLCFVLIHVRQTSDDGNCSRSRSSINTVALSDTVGHTMTTHSENYKRDYILNGSLEPLMNRGDLGRWERHQVSNVNGMAFLKHVIQDALFRQTSNLFFWTIRFRVLMMAKMLGAHRNVRTQSHRSLDR